MDGFIHSFIRYETRAENYFNFLGQNVGQGFIRVEFYCTKCITTNVRQPTEHRYYH